MVDLIRRNWNPNQGASGQVQVKFTVRRDGTVTDIEIEKSSNISLLDLESQRALVKTKALPPLPREFTENTLTVHLNFDYHR
jgi:TonB family protein